MAQHLCFAYCCENNVGETIIETITQIKYVKKTVVFTFTQKGKITVNAGLHVIAKIAAFAEKKSQCSLRSYRNHSSAIVAITAIL